MKKHFDNVKMKKAFPAFGWHYEGAVVCLAQSTACRVTYVTLYLLSVAWHRLFIAALLLLLLQYVFRGDVLAWQATLTYGID